MLLSNYLDVEKLKQYVSEGWVMEQKHPQFPLALYTYTRQTVYEDKWDDITTKTRCLIVNLNTGEIIARSFEKFFNLNTESIPETWYDNLPEGDCLVLEKLDGSLGVLYTYNGKSYIASKGSFISDHAKWATKEYNRIVKSEVSNVVPIRGNTTTPVWPEGYTPVFEMICEDVQHHIVHYGTNDLVLLALINNETGEELNYASLYHWAKKNGFKIPKKIDLSLNQVMAQDGNGNEEGYVLSWFRLNKPPLKVKYKFNDFLRKQKIINGTNPKTILQLLEQDYIEGTDSIPALVENTTPEFTEWVYRWEKKLNDEFTRIFNDIGIIYNDAVLDENNKTRKDFALVFMSPDNKKYHTALFNMLDQDVDGVAKSVWHLCKPLVIGQSGMKIYNEDE